MHEGQHERQLQQQLFDLKLPSVPIEHLKFQSLSEYACAKLLEKYTDWQGINGVTFQVPIGRTYFDFMVANTLIEYHPISIRREFAGDSLGDILSAIHSLPKGKRTQLLSGVADELAAQYDKRRKQVASAHPVYKNADVICAFSAEDFVHKVIYRFANKRCPGGPELVTEFRKFQMQAKTVVNRSLEEN